MAVYIYQQHKWPNFLWDQEQIAPILGEVRYRQGRLSGRMEGLGFDLQAEANLHTLTLDVLKSSEIGNEFLDAVQVRSSIARRLGIDIGGPIAADRTVEGIAEMMLNAVQDFNAPLTKERLFSWHAALFPATPNEIKKEKIHSHVPGSDVRIREMRSYLDWFDEEKRLDPVIKAAVAHLWFVIIHPFGKGNGRIARAIANLQLSRADGSAQRFYSMSAQIRLEREQYYQMLEKTRKDDPDITVWIKWFLGCLDRSIANANETLAGVKRKARFWEKYAADSFNERQRTLLNKLLDGFDGKLTSSKWAGIFKISQDSAGRDIADLVKKGILTREPGGGRNTSYMLTPNA